MEDYLYNVLMPADGKLRVLPRDERVRLLDKLLCDLPTVHTHLSPDDTNVTLPADADLTQVLLHRVGILEEV